MSRLTAQLVADLEEYPLQPMGFERDSVMGRWTAVLAYYALRDSAVPDVRPTPVDTIAETLVTYYGLDERAARIRAAQITGSALGWRVFETYLVDTAAIEDVELDDLRADLTAIHRRSGASPWPTVDPPIVTPDST